MAKKSTQPEKEPEKTEENGNISDAVLVKDNEGSDTDNDVEEAEVIPEDQHGNTEKVHEITQELSRTQVARLDSFTSVEHVKAFAAELGLKGTSGQVLQAIVRGKELGIPALIAYDNIYYINGKASYSWLLINALIRSIGIDFQTKYDNWFLQHDGTVTQERGDDPADKIVEIHFYYKSKVTGNVITEIQRFGMKQADKAGLLDKDTWKKWTESLLWVRCFTFGARKVGGQALMGIRETSELADMENKSYEQTGDGDFIPV